MPGSGGRRGEVGALGNQTRQGHVEQPRCPQTLPHPTAASRIPPRAPPQVREYPCSWEEVLGRGEAAAASSAALTLCPSLSWPERWMALPDFPDYHKWGFSLTALNNTVYVTGGFPAAPFRELMTVKPLRIGCPLQLRRDSSRGFHELETRTFKIHRSTGGYREPSCVLSNMESRGDLLGSRSQGLPQRNCVADGRVTCSFISRNLGARTQFD